MDFEDELRGLAEVLHEGADTLTEAVDKDCLEAVRDLRNALQESVVMMDIVLGFHDRVANAVWN